MPNNSHQTESPEGEPKGFLGLHGEKGLDHQKTSKEGMPLGSIEAAEARRELDQLGDEDEAFRSSGLEQYREGLKQFAEGATSSPDSGQADRGESSHEFTEADQGFMTENGISPEVSETAEQADEQRKNPESAEFVEENVDRKTEQDPAIRTESEQELREAERIMNTAERREARKVFIFLAPVERRSEEEKFLDQSYTEYFKGARDRIKAVRAATPKGLKWLSTAVQAAAEIAGALALTAGKVGRKAAHRFKREQSFKVGG